MIISSHNYRLIVDNEKTTFGYKSLEDARQQGIKLLKDNPHLLISIIHESQYESNRYDIKKKIMESIKTTIMSDKTYGRFLFNLTYTDGYYDVEQSINNMLDNMQIDISPSVIYYIKDVDTLTYIQQYTAKDIIDMADVMNVNITYEDALDIYHQSFNWHKSYKSKIIDLIRSI